MQPLDIEGGRMPFAAGFLQQSLMASTATMPSIHSGAKPVEGRTYKFDFGIIEAVIAGASLEDDLYFGYTAAYAGHQEYGAKPMLIPT
nr:MULTISPECIES: hypothetical protein [unclassified Rhizobium]